MTFEFNAMTAPPLSGRASQKDSFEVSYFCERFHGSDRHFGKHSRISGERGSGISIRRGGGDYLVLGEIDRIAGFDDAGSIVTGPALDREFGTGRTDN